MINKFRIFDKIENEYCEGSDYKWSLSRNGKFLYNYEYDEWHIIGERYVVEFSTGIGDINANELFEGDICKVKDWYSSDDKEDGFIGEVIFEDGSFFVYRSAKKCQFYQKLDSCSVSNRNITKIGNRFKNVEQFFNDSAV